MILNIFIFITFIILSAFFSASETAIFSLGKLRLQRLKEKYPQAQIIEKLLNRPARLLSALVFGNILVNIGLSSLAVAICVKIWGKPGMILAIIGSGTIILYLGEIFPKTIAIHLAEKISLGSSPVLSIFSKIFAPFIVTMEKVVEWFLSLFIHRYKTRVTFSDEELKTVLFLGKKEGQITAAEEEMISYVLEFKDTWVSEVITARIDIQGIDSTHSQKEVFDILREKKHSKFPVYDKSLDNIIGILYAKDVFLNPSKDYRKLLREVIFVPESKRIDDLLKIFKEKQQRAAIVLDEYGGTEGLVTLEDIQEEIFGEIYDEFETPRQLLQKIDEGKWRVHGKEPIKTLNLELDLGLPEEEDTVAGFLLSAMEKIPKKGDTFKYGNLIFFVEKATKRRILSVILQK
ncbi:MAG: hemolysin family protein [Candidatus Omnitrophota bacterium]|nr:hemolysin family protein [Candidatus Omnitrophota bacterium]